MKKYIHVDQRNIRKNLKEGTNLPIFTVLTYKSNIKCHNVKINGPCELVYSPNKPLNCGARVFISTEAEVEID